MALTSQDEKYIDNKIENFGTKLRREIVEDLTDAFEKISEKQRNEFHNQISPILKEIETNALERIVMVNNIENHDQRIDKLEHKAGII